MKNCLFSRRGGGSIIRNHKNTFLGQKFQNIFFFSNFFLKYFFHFLSQKVTKFCSKKKKERKYFYAKTILENIFLQKKMFLNFLSQKVTKFCSKKKKMKKNIFMQKQFWKIYFLEKKNVFEFFVPKSD